MKNMILKFVYWLLAKYARKVINLHRPFVIAVTGSVGKSSTKEAIFQVLHDNFGSEVRKNYGNLNAEIGIPLTILGYDRVPSKILWPVFLILAYFRTFQKKYPKYIVLEMGVEHPGDLQYFSTIVKPDIGVITAISAVHSANFGGIEGLVKEKLSMINIVKDHGKVIINNDLVSLGSLENDSKEIITIGVDSKMSTYRAESINLGLDGTDYRIITTGQKIAIKTSLIGKQFVYAQLIAFAIGQIFDIQSLKIKQSLEKIKPINGRLRLIEGKNGITILDDTYNADPLGVKAALDVLSLIKYSGRKVVIIGNMNELGKMEKEKHEEIATYAKGKCDLAIFAGPNAKLMAKSFGDSSVLSYDSRKTLENDLEKIIKPKDLILVKASQNKNYFEEITKKIMLKPDLAPDLLVRQGSFWRFKKRV
jgi:UDP-N-acetylmuramoyl-tripeptide--D-alanyl-D-alanine ligase